MRFIGFSIGFALNLKWFWLRAYSQLGRQTNPLEMLLVYKNCILFLGWDQLSLYSRLLFPSWFPWNLPQLDGNYFTQLLQQIHSHTAMQTEQNKTLCVYKDSSQNYNANSYNSWEQYEILHLFVPFWLKIHQQRQSQVCHSSVKGSGYIYDNYHLSVI